MYEQLIMRLLEDKSWIAQGTTETEHEIADHLQKAADAIEKLQEDSVPIDDMEMILSEVVKPRWIPVTETLPERGEDVQILFPNNQAVGFYDGFDWCIYSGDGWFSVVAEDEAKPTYWAKKLPEPPKEE